MSIYSLSRQRTERLWYVTQPFSGADWMTRAVRMANAVCEEAIAVWTLQICELGKSTWAFVETPDNWFNERGMDSKNAGDVQKLYWFVGYLVAQIANRGILLNLEEIWTVVPKAWKGQTPKGIMVDRGVAELSARSGIVFDDENRLPDDAAEACLLARIAAFKIRSKFSEGKGWARVWSRNLDLSAIRIREWQATEGLR